MSNENYQPKPLNISTMSSFIQPLSYTLIMAVDSRGGIGLENDLPWKKVGVSNKKDMEWFKQNTAGRIIIMGYNTWVSIGRKPLPGRYNVIISKEHGDEVRDDINNYLKNNNKDCINTLLAPTPEQAMIALEAGLGIHHKGGEVMVIGGAKIYEAFMPVTSRICLTTFDGEFEADTFVHLDLDKWERVYLDKRCSIEPMFEVWNCTEEATKRADSDVLKIEHVHKPAAGHIAEILEAIAADKAKKEGENV